MRYETKGFDEYLNVYNEKNKLVFYSVEVDYMRPKRLLYDKSHERLSMIDFGTDDVDDLIYGYPITVGGDKVGYYDDTVDMSSTRAVAFAHIKGPEWDYIELSERFKFLEYAVRDSEGNNVMKIRRSGTDFICDIPDGNNTVLALSLASVEYWKYITTTREF
ncbi:MAG: hypothetical protein IJP17_04790 [Clostridia bacterium]|nr:hypothetical protein [Clostridia bacterium]